MRHLSTVFDVGLIYQFILNLFLVLLSFVANNVHGLFFVALSSIIGGVVVVIPPESIWSTATLSCSASCWAISTWIWSSLALSQALQSSWHNDVSMEVHVSSILLLQPCGSIGPLRCVSLHFRDRSCWSGWLHLTNGSIMQMLKLVELLYEDRGV